MKDILFEDLYTYTNKFYKDQAKRSAGPITKTLSDIIKGSPEEYNKQTSNFIPYPGNAIIDSLGIMFTKTSDVSQLIDQLFNNPSTNYDEKTQKDIKMKLNKIMIILKSLSKDLDNNESNN